MKRIIYEHSITELGALRKQWLATPVGKLCTQERKTKALATIDAMIAERTNPARSARALPKKQERALGLLPSVEAVKSAGLNP